MSKRRKPARKGSQTYYQRPGQNPRPVVVQQAREESNDAERVDRLANLLSQALSRKLGMQSSGEPVDYSPTLSPTTDANSILPGESIK